MWIAGVLFILALIWPFFWVFFFGYVIWFVLTGRKRRNRVVALEIFRLINSGRTQVELPYLYYEAAQKCALEHGAELAYKTHRSDPVNDTLTFRVPLPEAEYLVTVQRWGKGTLLSVSNESDPNSITNKVKSILNSGSTFDFDDSMDENPDFSETRPFVVTQPELKRVNGVARHDSPEMVDDYADAIVEEIWSMLPTEMHIFQYVMCEIEGAYIASEDNENARKLYVSSGFLEQEFEGMLSNADRMDEDPSPLLYMDGQVSPFLRTNYGMDLAVKIRCMIVHKLLTKYKTEIDECRLFF